MVLNIEHSTKALELNAGRQKRTESAESVQAEQRRIKDAKKNKRNNRTQYLLIDRMHGSKR